MILRLVAGALIVFGIPAALPAQHYHQHGGHLDYHQNVPHGHDRAGHLIDGAGHHIDGHGNHTGRVGVYENGSMSIPSYRSSYYGSYYGSFYPQLLAPGIGYQSLGVYGSPYNARPYSSQPYNSQPYNSQPYNSQPYYPNVVTPGATSQSVPGIAPNAIPTRKAQRPLAQARLFNPRENEGEVRYTLNDIPYTIRPGESQTIQLDREWIIRFDNGYQKQVAYRLEEGAYSFSVSELAGWDLAKQVFQPDLRLP